MQHFLVILPLVWIFVTSFLSIGLELCLGGVWRITLWILEDIATCGGWRLDYISALCFGACILALSWRIYFDLALEDYISALAWRFAFGGLEHKELVLIGHLETW